MSWSVQAVGKPEAVATKLANDFQRITYLGKEEASLKDAVAELVAKVLALNTRKDALINVQANGSGSTHPADGSQQTVSLSISSLYGFVE